MAVDDETTRQMAAPTVPAQSSGLRGSRYATGAAERRARSDSIAAARAAGKELQAHGLSTAYEPSKPYSLSLSDLASRRYLGILELPSDVSDSEDEESRGTRLAEAERRARRESELEARWEAREEWDRAQAQERDERARAVPYAIASSRR